MAHSALMEPLRRWDPGQLGGYVLLGRLGAGAMGRVYLGRSASGRLVAVKTIRVELAEEPDFRTRFAREVAAARRVSGAFTAAVVAADPDADVPWLATTYVPAPSLSMLVSQAGPLPVTALRWLAAGCAEALESIHAAGIVHRDLKPSNVLVALDGPRVIDFGIARAAERAGHTMARGAVGTPAYMAPEQARDASKASPASDIYSLGATVLMAATGHGPCRGDTALEVLAHLASAPPDLSGLPDELHEVVTACLAADPLDRPASAELLAGLAGELCHSGQPLEAGSAVLPAPALALIGRYRRDLPPETADGGPPQDAEQTLGSLVTMSSRWPASGPDVLRSLPSGATMGSDPAPSGPARAGVRPPAGPGSRRGPGAGRRPGGPGRARSRRTLLVVGAGIGAICLLACGVLVGAELRGQGAPRFPGTAGESASGDAASHRGSGSPAVSTPQPRGTSPTPAVAPAPEGGFPPPGRPVPDVPYQVHARALATGRPAMGVSQPSGDSDTGFVLIGAGWRPGEHLTIRLVGHGISPFHPPADLAGNFNYVINEGHEFFRGGIPAGHYRVVVSAGGFITRASFTVLPASSPGASA